MRKKRLFFWWPFRKLSWVKLEQTRRAGLNMLGINGVEITKWWRVGTANSGEAKPEGATRRKRPADLAMEGVASNWAALGRASGTSRASLSHSLHCGRAWKVSVLLSQRSQSTSPERGCCIGATHKEGPAVGAVSLLLSYPCFAHWGHLWGHNAYFQIIVYLKELGSWSGQYAGWWQPRYFGSVLPVSNCL